MCGIGGFIGGRLTVEEKPAQLCRMLAALLHRGPDEMGYYFDQRVGLVNARLAILDLVGGQQPMVDVSGRYWIVFNGEIFNYIELRKELESHGVQFSQNSDTQVLLYALIHWGVEDAIERLNGQFAFALYDSHSGSVAFGRDRWGERPLYLYKQNGFLAFASEIKALAVLPEVDLALDSATLSLTAWLWTPLQDASVFQNITQLPPSHFAVFAKGELTIMPYSDRPFHPASLPKTDGEAIEAVRASLSDAIKLRLRSDVEVALYLSGGLDSTITAALGQKLGGGDLRSFSVGFDDGAFDETDFQETAAKAIGTKHTSLRITHADIRTHLPDVVKHAETMLFRTAPVPLYLLAKKVHEAGIKVVLTGEGADEVFYGYDIFKEAWFLDQFDQFADDDARTAALAKLYPYLPHFNTRESRALLPYYRTMAARKESLSPAHMSRISNGALAASLFVNAGNIAEAQHAFEMALERQVPSVRTLSSVARAVAAERLTLMHGYLLSSQGDRMSSAYSLESRYAFLDPSVVALAERLPENLKLHNGLEEKWILKQAFGDMLPDVITQRPKQPYRAPGSACLRRGRNDWLDALIASERLPNSNVIDASSAGKIIEQVHRLAPERISPKLDTAYITLITTLLLEDQFITNRRESMVDISHLLKVTHRGKQ